MGILGGRVAQGLSTLLEKMTTVLGALHEFMLQLQAMNRYHSKKTFLEAAKLLMCLSMTFTDCSLVMRS